MKKRIARILHKIFHIVLTGGPCAGKTSLRAYLKQKLEQRGFIVLFSPEAASIGIGGGLNPNDPVVGVEIGQTAITDLTYQIENVFRAMAERLAAKAPVVIFYDRGITDARAYVSEKMYGALVKKYDLTPEEIRDQRYHGVIHLVTAADGAEKFYTLANNQARHETPRQARAQDKKTKAAWMGHEHLRVIDNSTGFRKKVDRAFREICGILGTPPIEHERKFLVSFDLGDLPKDAQRVDIEQFYLVSADPRITLRLRKRGQHGRYTYYRTMKQPCGHGKNIEVQDFVTESEYLISLQFKRPDTAVVRKKRTCFLYKNQYFELDTFARKSAIPGQALLELEITDSKQKISFPRWLKVKKEVTGDPAFSNLAIAKVLAKN